MAGFERFGWKLLPKDKEWLANKEARPSYVHTGFQASVPVKPSAPRPKNKVGRPAILVSQL